MRASAYITARQTRQHRAIRAGITVRAHNDLMAVSQAMSIIQKRFAAIDVTAELSLVSYS